jgi:nitrogen fixation-related uncharacterized protein
MGDACFSPASLALLVAIGGVLQGVIVTLFWLAIRSKDDSIKDARELRDRALDINEQMIPPMERQADAVTRAVVPRGRR